jgi:hypothetical protein
MIYSAPPNLPPTSIYHHGLTPSLSSHRGHRHEA